MTRTPTLFTVTIDPRISRCAALLCLCSWLVASPCPSLASYQPNCCGTAFWPTSPWVTPIFPTTPSPSVTSPTTQAASAAPVVGLTKVGNPTWKVTDFQLFTAPAAPFPDAFLGTLDALLPLEGPGATTYTPHAGPYDHELSTNAAAAGFVNSNVFQHSAITFDPNGVFFMYMMLPDPGITGSSRDFASGPIIPNSLFPFTSNAEMWLDGAKVETLQDNVLLNVRQGDVPFDGQSHRAPSQAVWYPWADPNAGPLGSHELRMSVRDNGGNGWDMVAAFEVVPEPGAMMIGLAGVVGLALNVGRKRRSRRLSC